MAKLYELTNHFKAVSALLDDESIDEKVISDTIESIELAIEDKAQNIAIILQGMDYDIETLKAEEKRLAGRRKALENNKENLKTYLRYHMEIAKLNKIKSPNFTVALQNNPPSLEIVDEKAIPPKYLTVIPETYVLDKARIKEALKEGEEIPGARLFQDKSIRIK